MLLIWKKHQDNSPFLSSFRWEIPIVIKSSSVSFLGSSEIMIESVESILFNSVFSSITWFNRFLYSRTIFKSEIFVLVSRAACEKISRAFPPSFETEISRRRGRISISAKKKSTASFRVSRGRGTKNKDKSAIQSRPRPTVYKFQCCGRKPDGKISNRRSNDGFSFSTQMDTKWKPQDAEMIKIIKLPKETLMCKKGFAKSNISLLASNAG